MKNISAVIITKNEERVIERCLSSLTFCNDIVVVDSGSSDATVALCSKFGARVIHRDFDGFGSQKNFAVLQAKFDWVFVIDADEVVTPELAKEISSLPESPANAGFSLKNSLVFQNKILRFGRENIKRHVRLFNRSCGNYNSNDVHEFPVLVGPIGKLNGLIMHYSYENLEDYIGKFNRYTSLAASQFHSQNKRVGIFPIMIKVPFTFFKTLVLRGSIFDGWPGILWATLSAFYVLVKYAKLHELYSKDKEPQR